MTRKRFSEEAALDLLRQIDLDLASGSTVETSARNALKVRGLDRFEGKSLSKVKRHRLNTEFFAYHQCFMRVRRNFELDRVIDRRHTRVSVLR